jgi:hypothetical protein
MDERKGIILRTRSRERMGEKKTLLKELFSELVEEIRTLLQAGDRTDLISSLESAIIVDKCRCGDDFCSSIYTAARPTGSWGADHETVPLEPQKGLINLDTVAGRIVYIEVIDRPNFRNVLNKMIK